MGLVRPHSAAILLGTVTSDKGGGGGGLLSSFKSCSGRGNLREGHGKINCSGRSLGETKLYWPTDIVRFFFAARGTTLLPPLVGLSTGVDIFGVAFPELARRFLPPVMKLMKRLFSFSSQRSCLLMVASSLISSSMLLKSSLSEAATSKPTSLQLGVAISLYSSFSRRGVNGTSGTTKLSMLYSELCFFLLKIGVVGRLPGGEVKGDAREWLRLLTGPMEDTKGRVEHTSSLLQTAAVSCHRNQ